ncbi:MAG TPA: VOC family protein, partial [Methylomirabilota bacterium]|nr:VOC family protein [Methylomirabilota bacterium]
MTTTAIRFDHIAIAAARIADAPAVLAGALGGVPAIGAASAAYTWATWRYANGGHLEVLEPRGEDGFLHRFLAARGPGVHHVTFRVPSLADACARAAERGYRIVGHDASDPAWSEAFLHPKEALGIVVQIVESPDEPPRGHWRKPPPMPPDPPPPGAIVGLRRRALGRARRHAMGGRSRGRARGTGRRADLPVARL